MQRFWNGRRSVERLALAMVAPAIVATMAQPAAAQYRLTPIPLPAGGLDSEAHGVNNFGAAAGWQRLSTGVVRAFRYDGVTVDDFATIGPFVLGDCGDNGVHGINNAGVVVGSYLIPGVGVRAFAYDGVFHDITQDLSTANPDRATAYAINAAGEVAGTHQFFVSPSNPSECRAARWSAGWSLVDDLGAFDPQPGFSRAFAINDAAEVGGFSNRIVGGNNWERPVIWTGAGMGELPTFDPNGREHGRVNGINNLAQSAGRAWDRLGTGWIRPVMWNAGVMTNLGGVSIGNGESFGINAAGHVVGTNLNRAFVWNGSLQDLNNMIPPGSGWILKTAYSISDTGFIAGVGDPPGNVGTQAFVLEPCSLTILSQPQPTTVDRGDSVVLTATVVGAGPLSFAWLKDGLPIPTSTPCGSGYATSVTGSPSAATATLTISNAVWEDSAAYSVSVTGACGTALSDLAGVTVACLGDIDGDHQVGQGDLAALLASYNLCAGDPGYNGLADLDCSGCVDQADLAALLARYNEVCP